MDTTQTLKVEIEAAASTLGIAPSTVGERAGQGGRFYARLCAGKRVWPETAQSVRNKLAQLIHSLDSAPVAGADSAEGSLPDGEGANAPLDIQGPVE